MQRDLPADACASQLDSSIQRIAVTAPLRSNSMASSRQFILPQTKSTTAHTCSNLMRHNLLTIPGKANVFRQLNQNNSNAGEQGNDSIIMASLVRNSCGREIMIQSGQVTVARHAAHSGPVDSCCVRHTSKFYTV